MEQTASIKIPHRNLRPLDVKSEDSSTTELRDSASQRRFNIKCCHWHGDQNTEYVMWSHIYIAPNTDVYLMWRHIYLSSKHIYMCDVASHIYVPQTQIYMWCGVTYMCATNTDICVMRRHIYMCYKHRYMCGSVSHMYVTVEIAIQNNRRLS